MTISVCVITRNRPVSLDKALLHVAAQTCKAIEIIVVDNSTNPKTENLIKNKWKDAVYLRCDGAVASQPIMRNAAIGVARGDVIAFIDDDGYPEPRWLEEIMRGYSSQNVGGVGGRIIQGGETVSIRKGKCNVGYWDFIRGPVGNYNCPVGGVFEVEHLQGTNMTFRLSVLKEVGGFDLFLSKGYAAFEDTEIALAVRGKGYKILFNTDAVVVHGVLQRDGFVGRKIGEKPMLAYYYGRNHAYVTIKHFGLGVKEMLQAGIIGWLVDSKRCLSSLPIGGLSLWFNLFGRFVGMQSSLYARCLGGK